MSMPYPKINAPWKRDDKGRILPNTFARPEFEYLLELPWLWTEKVDGTNIRLSYHVPNEDRELDGEAGEYIKIGYDRFIQVQGRTDRAQIPTHLLASLKEQLAPLPWERVFDYCRG